MVRIMGQIDLTSMYMSCPTTDVQIKGEMTCLMSARSLYKPL